ncbi:FAD/NAD(P)-binding protein [Burkholderia pseudomallei]|nr:FAD/NAD(P)-binding domain-containing protein [Burkholderia pseudomallei]
MASIKRCSIFGRACNEFKDVAVIGGRASGTAAAIHLVECLPAGSSVHVIDPRDVMYPSVFHDRNALLIANTSHEANSLFPDLPDDFLSFLGVSERQGSIPRYVVGEYCHKRLAEAIGRALRRGIRFSNLTDSVQSVRSYAEGYELTLASGRTMYASDVVVAVGLGTAKPIDGLNTVPPYPSHNLRRFAKSKALVIGKGQSGIEAALVLCAEGTEVTMCSRTGRFPAVRSRTPVAHFRFNSFAEVGSIDFRSYVDQDCRRRGYPPLSDLLAPLEDPVSMLRKEIKLAEEDCCPWQDPIVSIIDAIIDTGASVVDDREFLWRYVTAINLATAQRLLDRIEHGSIVSTTLDAVDFGQFDLIVRATGFLRPNLYRRDRTLHFGGREVCVPDAGPVDVGRDLRLTLSDAHGPERIWAVGPASCVPFANFLHTATRQAKNVAEQIASPDKTRGVLLNRASIAGMPS